MMLGLVDVGFFIPKKPATVIGNSLNIFRCMCEREVLKSWGVVVIEKHCDGRSRFASLLSTIVERMHMLLPNVQAH